MDHRIELRDAAPPARLQPPARPERVAILHPLRFGQNGPSFDRPSTERRAHQVAYFKSQGEGQHFSAAQNITSDIVVCPRWTTNWCQRHPPYTAINLPGRLKDACVLVVTGPSFPLAQRPLPRRKRVAPHLSVASIRRTEISGMWPGATHFAIIEGRASRTPDICGKSTRRAANYLVADLRRRSHGISPAPGRKFRRAMWASVPDLEPQNGSAFWKA